MTKIDYIVAALSAELREEGLTEDGKKEKIKDALRQYATDMMNVARYLAEQKLPDEQVKELISMHGADFNLKTRKFF